MSDKPLWDTCWPKITTAVAPFFFVGSLILANQGMFLLALQSLMAGLGAMAFSVLCAMGKREVERRE